MVQSSPEPDQTISFIKEESFKPTLKCKEGVCPPNQNWDLIPQDKSLIAEGSGSHTTFGDSRNHKKPCALGVQHSCEAIGNYRYEFFKIRWCLTRWCLTIKGFVGEEKYFKFYSGFYREPSWRS